MVRATIIVSALFVMVASVAAVPRPHGAVANVADNDVLSHILNLSEIELEDLFNEWTLLNNIDVLKRDVTSSGQTVQIKKVRTAEGKGKPERA